MGTPVLIMVLGMLVPMLTAAPFYVRDARAQRRAEEGGRLANVQSTLTPATCDEQLV